ncbi:UNVERIFIED_CONTAM: hypothetical protein Sindi_2779400 [Sesamum indicum]
MATASNSTSFMFFFALLTISCVSVWGDDGCVISACGPRLKDPCWCCYSADVQPPLHPEDICFPTHEACEAWPCPPLPPAAYTNSSNSIP